jgi:hypothetical protein
MEKQTVYHFFASSILFVYEGYEVTRGAPREGGGLRRVAYMLVVACVLYFIAPGSSQWDEPDRFAHASSRAPAPALPQIGGGVLVYDLDVMLQVATERRWEFVMRVSLWVYGSDVWCVWVDARG